MKYPKVSIIIINYNGGQEPINCLKSISKLTYPKDKTEIIIIDNGSTDGSPQKIVKLFPKVNLIKLEHDIGYPASLNLGILNATGDYIFLGNDDITLERNSITLMVEHLIKNKKIAVVGGKVYLKNSGNIAGDSANSYNFYTGGFTKPTDNNSILWLQSCAIMIPKTVFEKIGLFDRFYYPLYFDDFDFCLRAKRAGYQLEYLPQAIFHHGGGKTTAKYPNLEVYYWWYKNKIRFMIKNATFLQTISVMILLVASALSKTIREKQFVFQPLTKAAIFNITNLHKTLEAKNKLAPKDIQK